MHGRGVTAVVAALFVVAFATYATLWDEAPLIQGDSRQYMAVAADLSDGRLERLHDRSIGYPLLLWGTGAVSEPTRMLFYASLLLHFASIGLLAAALYRVCALPARWTVAFTAILLLPGFVEPAGHVMTETLGQFALAAACAALAWWWRSDRRAALVLAGAALGFAALVRPAYVALPPALAIGLLLSTRLAGFRLRLPRAAAAAAVLLAMWAVIGGSISAYNATRFGYFGISPLIGFHLSTKTMAWVERLPDEYTAVREILVRYRAVELLKPGSTHTGSQTVWEARPELHAATGLGTAELSAYLVRMNLVLIRRGSVEYVGEVVRSFSAYWLPAHGPLAGLGSGAVRWFNLIVHFALVAAFFVLMVALAGGALTDTSLRLAGAPGLVLHRIRVTRDQQFVFSLALAIVLYTVALTCVLDIGEPRQRRPTDILLVALCFIGAWGWLTTVRVEAASQQVPDAHRPGSISASRPDNRLSGT